MGFFPESGLAFWLLSAKFPAHSLPPMKLSQKSFFKNNFWKMGEKH
jgi:hypothetical protein